MFNVSRWSIANPVPSILLFIMLTAAGLLGFRAMKIQQFPDIDLPMVSVTASLPGAAPAQMETEVARRIENALASAQGLKHLYTKVQDGVATVTAEFRLEKPTQEALDDVRDAIRAGALDDAFVQTLHHRNRRTHGFMHACVIAVDTRQDVVHRHLLQVVVG